ncbi:MAG: strawberry notch family protein [Lachnospiraceae bacterium]|nr:strawberry notch family protein [Lachnospiraceae bacterium]
MTQKYSNDYSIKSLGSIIPAQLAGETENAYHKLREALGGDVAGYVANRLQMTPEEISVSLAQEQVDGIAFALYNIEARGESVIIGDQTGIGKGRQAAAMIRYGMLAGYFPIFLTDRYTLFSDMYRDCKALGIKDARPLILNSNVSVVDFDKPVEEDHTPTDDEIWSPVDEDSDEEEIAGIYVMQYEEVYKSPKKSQLECMYENGDIPEHCYEYMMLTYSQLKDAKKDMTRLDFLTSLCEKHRVLFIFDEAHKSSSVTAGKPSVITKCINSILANTRQTQCVFLSATFAKRPECLITFMQQTVLSSLATSETLRKAFANGGVPMQEYVAAKLAKEGQMIRREHSGEGIPAPVYTYLDEKYQIHSELFDKVMYWFRELVKLSLLVKRFISMAAMLGVNVFKQYPTRAQLFYVNKILLLSLKARDVAEAAVREVQTGKSVVIGMSDTLECILRDSIDNSSGECRRADFSVILLRILQKTISNPKKPSKTVFDIDLNDVEDPTVLNKILDEIRAIMNTIESGIKEDIFHLPMSPIDVIRQLITQESFTDKKGITRNIRFEECTGRVRQLEYLSPEGEDEFINATVISRKKRHSNHIYNDFQNNKLDVILINACGASGASAHAIATTEVPEDEVRQRKMLIVQNDLDVNIDLQKRGRINRTGQIEGLPPLYEYIITAIPSEKRLNMMLRAKLRSLSANTTADQDQDKRQADFIDITNKYGNTVTQDFLAANPELAFILGLGKSTTASQLLARIAMLSVSAQQDIIDEIFSSYQNLEQELRRINQWDLEREYRDFEAEFVRDELFSSPIDDTALGGASILTTFRCRHRTFPYDSAALQKSIDKSSQEYGVKLADSEKLKKEIYEYYRIENKKIRDRVKERKAKIEAMTIQTLLKYGVKEDVVTQMITLAQRPRQLYDSQISDLIKGSPKIDRVHRKIESYKTDYDDLEFREKNDLKAKAAERKRLMEVISNAVIGRAYDNVAGFLPLEECFDRIMAVLKEIRFGKTSKHRFTPGKVQFVFALSAVHKEIVLNLVDNGNPNNYDRLIGILTSSVWPFNSVVWDTEIAKYNNRVLERKIITGNILGAFAHPLIAKIKPRFITFSLASEGGLHTSVERGLLLPLAGGNVEKLMEYVALPLAEGLKYANSSTYVYQVSGIGIDFAITPSFVNKDLQFFISINEKDSRRYESDERFDAIRSYFKGTEMTSIHNSENSKPKRPLIHYSTDRIPSSSAEFNEIMTLLASLRAVIMIPRPHLTVGEMKHFAKGWNAVEISNWPHLDWHNNAPMPPVRKEVQIRISPPVTRDENILYVDEYPAHILLLRRTLAYHGRSFRENTIPGQLRALYFEWTELVKNPSFTSDNKLRTLAFNIIKEIHGMLVNSAQEELIIFNNITYRNMKEELSKIQLSAVGKIKVRFKDEMLFLAPPKEVVEKFLDDCLNDWRLKSIRTSLENYLNGKTEIIIDL